MKRKNNLHKLKFEKIKVAKIREPHLIYGGHRKE